MKDINQANRQCCKLDIREYGTNRPWMFADFCNTTTAGFSSDPVFAMKMGGKEIKFDNPIDATMSISFQVHPFRIYAMLSDGVVETTAVIPVREDVVYSGTGNALTVTGTPIAGTVFVYKQGEIGGTPVEGTFATKTFTGTALEAGTYTVCYLETKTTGVKKVSFNDKKLPKDFRITQETLDKDEFGNWIPVKMTAYKASPQRSMEWSWSSEGDPTELTITFDVLKDSEGNVLDMVEITEED